MEIISPKQYSHDGKPLPYGLGTAVRGASGFVYFACSGLDTETGTYPEGLGAQTTVALERIKDKLEHFNTSLENICFMFFDQVRRQSRTTHMLTGVFNNFN